MIMLRTMVNVADNSGAKRAQCIKVLGGHHRRCGRLGDIVVVAVRDAIPGAAVKKGDVAKAVVVRAKKERVGRNPQTGEPIPISARRVLTFKPSQVLKSVLNPHRDAASLGDDDDDDDD